MKTIKQDFRLFINTDDDTTEADEQAAVQAVTRVLERVVQALREVIEVDAWIEVVSEPDAVFQLEHADHVIAEGHQVFRLVPITPQE